ncbi:MAG: right-handed parallel beta-helix repeat-containing protein [Candidatus Omnitrophica bacterium]|nr:right-handed parallel beta-helix repeat-containing protein [Candidatus Omnitrophota bacterium]
MAIYYVSTTGRNTDPGTLVKPWRTLAYAESKLSSGDVVYVRGGVYQEYFKIDVPDVTFQNYPGESPIIDGNEEIPGEWTPLVNINSDGVTFDGFEVRESTGLGISLSKGDNIVVRNCTIHETFRHALRVINGADNALIENCDIHHGSKRRWYYENGYPTYTSPWPPTVSTKYCANPTFRSCKIHDPYWEGIDIDVGTIGATVEYCEIYGSARLQLYLVNSINHTVRYNLIYGTTNGTGSGIWIGNEAQWETPILITNNQIYGNLVANTVNNFWIAGATGRIIKNVTAYNNIFVEANEYGFRVEGSTGGDHYFKNNIIWQTEGQISNIPGGKVDCDYNLWSRTPDVDSQGPNDPPYALPKLTKTSGWNNLIGGELTPEDFILQPDSPAIDKGIPIDGMTHDFFGTPIPQGSAPDIGAVEYTDVSDPCEGVVCDNVCIGNDLWSQKCEGGSCIPDQLIESNSVACGYDPCEGVVCDNVCIGDDLWSQKCVDGYCVPNQLIESNSISCGYDPCEGVVCDNVCIGNDLWSRKCVDGSCVPDQLIESNSVTCELCEGVVCDNICVGDDLWSQSCDPDTGTCVANQLLQQDSINCKIPDKVPSDESTIKTYIILGGFGIMGLAMLILRKQ